MNFMGWYFEQLFNHPIKTKAVTRSVRDLKVQKPPIITLQSPLFQLCHSLVGQLCLPKDVFQCGAQDGRLVWSIRVICEAHIIPL